MPDSNTAYVVALEAENNMLAKALEDVIRWCEVNNRKNSHLNEVATKALAKRAKKPQEVKQTETT